MGRGRSVVQGLFHALATRDTHFTTQVVYSALPGLSSQRLEIIRAPCVLPVTIQRLWGRLQAVHVFLAP